VALKKQHFAEGEIAIFGKEFGFKAGMLKGLLAEERKNK
jgi:hypothetical protein